MLSDGQRHYLETGEKVEGGPPSLAYESQIHRAIVEKVEAACDDITLILESPFLPDDKIDKIEQHVRDIRRCAENPIYDDDGEGVDFDGMGGDA